MKLVFVNIMQELQRFDSTAYITQPPVPLAILAGATPGEIETALLDEQADRLRFEGDVFAFSVSTQNAGAVYRHADALRAAGKRVVLGSRRRSCTPGSAPPARRGCCSGRWSGPWRRAPGQSVLGHDSGRYCFSQAVISGGRPMLARSNVWCYSTQEVTREMGSARDYFDALSAAGRHHFTLAEAVVALGGSVVAVRAALRRASQRGEVASPHRGFFVVVPPEYRRLRCLPPEQFVPQLMKHLGEPYYVALLSAAELHGAAHHRPQRFQVMVRKNRRPIECGEARVQFVARRDLERTPVVEQNTPRGRMRVSSQEATALEIVGYADPCGGLDNVASVLSELAESLDRKQLLEAARLCPVVWSQRLGYLLELTGRDGPASVLADHVRTEGATLAPLMRARSMKGAVRAERWRLAINASVEADL